MALSGSDLREILEGTGITSVELAKQLRVHPTTVSNYVRDVQDFPEADILPTLKWIQEKTKARAEYAQNAVRKFTPSPKEYFEQLAERGGYMPEKTAEEIVEEIRGSRVGAVLHTPEDATP